MLEGIFTGQITGVLRPLQDTQGFNVFINTETKPSTFIRFPLKQQSFNGKRSARQIQMFWKEKNVFNMKASVVQPNLKKETQRKSSVLSEAGSLVWNYIVIL